MGRTYLPPRIREEVPAALDAHALFSTTDPAAAARLASPLLGRHRLAPSGGRSAAFGASLHAVAAGPVTLGYLRVETASELALAGSAARFLVVTPGCGGVSVTSGARSFEAGPDRAVVVQSGRPTTLRTPAGTLLVIGIERPPLVLHLRRLLGRALDRPLAFEAEFDLGSGRASRWNLAVELLHGELFEPGSLLRASVGQGQVEGFLMSSLLYGQASTYSGDLAGPDPSPEHRAIGAAKRFIEANLAERLTAADVAAAVGVSPRTLQAVFRTELRSTVTAYIRGRRLERTHDDLAAVAWPGRATVTEVATRWGITHLGRFAAAYRDRFGESPSHTLRRGSASTDG